MTVINLTAKLLKKLMAGIEYQKSGCWYWRGSKDRDGYGRMRNGETFVAPHRVACVLFHGQPCTEKPYALHSCDDPACCNPDHLRWGDQAENIREAVQKGRRWKGRTVQGAAANS